MNDNRIDLLLDANEEQQLITSAIESLGLTVIQHFEQRERPADYHSQRRTNKPLPKNPFPSRRILMRLRAMPIEIEGENGATADPPATKRPRVLGVRQFCALYNAIASSSGWWPLADSRWRWQEFFTNLEKYVMYLDEMPIGFGALERLPARSNVTRIVFVGIIPSMQGYRFGNYLFNFINHLAKEGGAELVLLSTAPEFDTMKGTGKPEQSASKMYIRAGFRLVQTDIVDARRMATFARSLETLNLPAYYRTHPGFERSLLVKRLCEEFRCRCPRLPAKAKGRS